MKLDISKIKKERTIQELLEFGILLIDKPSGPTSFDVVEFVCKTLGLRKTSHFGTLDPKVTGVLPIALNRACKFTGDFLGHDKEYVGIMHVHKELSIEEIQKMIDEKFLGKIMQRPPVKSRVARVIREREIKKFQILEKEEKDYLFVAEVQGGTYIRKLIDDLGDAIEVGAHMLELRRTHAGIFSEASPEFVNLYDFEKAVAEYRAGNDKKLREIIIPAEIISEIYPVYQLKKETLGRVLHGSPIMNDMLTEKLKLEKGEKFCIFLGDRFVETAKVTNEGKIIARPEFVLQPF